MSEQPPFGSPEPKLSATSSQPLPNYQYKPLPTSPATIRLCRFLPPPSPSLEEPVSCEIDHFDLDTAASMSYHALSYAWGEPIFDRSVNLNGYPLRTTSHLCKALQRLRFCGFEWIWVDAICIDQSNIPERNAQVSLMGRIYSSAASTAIYLGEADAQESTAVGLVTHLSALRMLLPNSEAADKSLQLTDTVCDTLTDCLGPGHPYLEECRREDHGQWRQFSDAVSALLAARSRDEKCRLLRALNLPDKSDSSWAGLAKVYHRPWFHRGWVLQEAVLSHRAIVILGDDQFCFEKLEASLIFLHQSSLGHHLPLQLTYTSVVPIVIKNMKEVSTDRNLVHLLRISHMCRTTDPRDKIYCLLGMAGGVAPKPDYSQTVEAVYRSYAVYFIANCEGLNLIRKSGIAHGASRANATWVPRWDRWSLQRTVDRTINGSRLFQACASVSAPYSLEEDFSLLKVRGLRFDSAGRFCSQTFSSKSHQDWISWERNISSVVQESPRCTTESYSKTLVMDANGHGIQRCLGRSAIPDFHFAELYKSVFMTNYLMDSTNIVYMGIIIDIARYHRFVMTSRGYLGWVPKDSEPSDTICIIFGVKVPLVLREVERGRHILIGEAYIEGIMGGEAVNDGNLVVEDFTLA